jgi:AcrR family transcriptional regulator
VAAGPSSRGAGATAIASDDRGATQASRRSAQVEHTRRALLRAARELFTADGYQATRTEEVVGRAGVTRGALYHHFRDKEDLFRAVFDEVEGEVSSLLQRRSADASASSWDLFRANSEIHLLAAAVNPSYRRIVLIDGPAVMGWTEWNERLSGQKAKIDEYLLGAIEEGSIDEQPLEALSQMLLSIGHGSAMYIAQAADPKVAHDQIEGLTERLLGGLSSAAGEPSAGRTCARGTTEKSTSKRPKTTTKKENR